MRVIGGPSYAPLEPVPHVTPPRYPSGNRSSRPSDSPRDAKIPEEFVLRPYAPPVARLDLPITAPVYDQKGGPGVIAFDAIGEIINIYA